MMIMNFGAEVHVTLDHRWLQVLTYNDDSDNKYYAGGKSLLKTLKHSEGMCQIK
jgi:hypothetical protein